MTSNNCDTAVLWFSVSTLDQGKKHANYSIENSLILYSKSMVDLNGYLGFKKV